MALRISEAYLVREGQSFVTTPRNVEDSEVLRQDNVEHFCRAVANAAEAAGYAERHDLQAKSLSEIGQYEQATPSRQRN